MPLPSLYYLNIFSSCQLRDNLSRSCTVTVLASCLQLQVLSHMHPELPSLFPLTLRQLVAKLRCYRIGFMPTITDSQSYAPEQPRPFPLTSRQVVAKFCRVLNPLPSRRHPHLITQAVAHTCHSSPPHGNNFL